MLQHKTTSQEWVSNYDFGINTVGIITADYFIQMYAVRSVSQTHKGRANCSHSHGYRASRSNAKDLRLIVSYFSGISTDMLKPSVGSKLLMPDIPAVIIPTRAREIERLTDAKVVIYRQLYAHAVGCVELVTVHAAKRKREGGGGEEKEKEKHTAGQMKSWRSNLNTSFLLIDSETYKPERQGLASTR